jgi:coenzyme F420-reducing hydrogenase alpha subunit
MSDRIDIGYVAKVEGEGGLHVEISEGRVTNVLLDVWEPPRFFEGFLVGRKYDEAPDLVARICGICPVSHMTTSITALENAMGLEPSEQTMLLRKLITVSQIAASHLVHLYVLVLPDYVGRESIMSMLPDYASEFQRFLKMKDILNRLTGLIGGRAIHPVTYVVNGFTHVPSISILKGIGKELAGIRDDALDVAKLIGSLKYPDLRSGEKNASLKSGASYFTHEKMIVTDQGEKVPLDSYYDFFTEEHLPPSNAKRSRFKGESFRVGALARMNNSFKSLSPQAKKAASAAGFKVPDHNPYHNNIAQTIEMVEAIEECIHLIDEIRELKDEDRSFRVRGGEGFAVTEAPRGMLLHHYVLNDRGVIEKANLVTPTAHHLLAMEQDVKSVVESMIIAPRHEIEQALNKLIRAYDPCFSCSVHVIALDSEAPSN